MTHLQVTVLLEGISDNLFIVDDDYGEKTISINLDGEEVDLSFIDHPSNEMSVRTICNYLLANLNQTTSNSQNNSLLRSVEKKTFLLMFEGHEVANGFAKIIL